MKHDYIVKDSSIWQNANIHRKLNNVDSIVRVGIIREEIFDERTQDTRYVVDVSDANGQFPVVCTRTERFGGVYNYEEYTRQTYKEGKDSASKGSYSGRGGDIVLVVYFNGDTRNGVIIGSIKHSARKEKLDKNNKVAYINEFNGIETKITADGEWTQTFKGLPTNANKLANVPTGNPIPAPEYDKNITGSYTKWDKTGSWQVDDNSTQSIRIDKPNGMIEITSGDTKFTINKKDGTYTITNKKTSITSSDSFSIKTKSTTIDSSGNVDIKSAKINTTGKVKQEGDVGIKGNTEVKGDTKITGKIDHTGDCAHSGGVVVGGGFSAGGSVSLAGGASPLLTEIIMIIGTGNLGAPVISSATVLKTAMTKAS